MTCHRRELELGQAHATDRYVASKATARVSATWVKPNQHALSEAEVLRFLIAKERAKLVAKLAARPSLH
jgi:hypothetical protein